MKDIFKTRIYGKKVDIDSGAVMKLYNDRSNKNGSRPIDAPTVLCSDTNIDNIEQWTSEEVDRWFPLFNLNDESVVLEIGFGTGRMSKYIIPAAKEYVGIDYAENLWNTAKSRNDIEKKKNTQLLNISLEQFLEEYQDILRENLIVFFCRAECLCISMITRCKAV